MFLMQVRVTRITHVCKGHVYALEVYTTVDQGRRIQPFVEIRTYYSIIVYAAK